MEGKDMIMIGSNNYLGLTSHPEVIEAGIKALEQYGSGCSGSRFLNGTLTSHVEFEKELAEFLKKEDAVQRLHQISRNTRKCHNNTKTSPDTEVALQQIACQQSHTHSTYDSTYKALNRLLWRDALAEAMFAHRNTHQICKDIV